MCSSDLLDPFMEFCEILEGALEDPIDLHSIPQEVCYMYPELHVLSHEDIDLLKHFEIYGNFSCVYHTAKFLAS